MKYASQLPRTTDTPSRELLERLAGLRPDRDVPQAEDLVHALPFDLREHRLQRGQVAVDVRDGASRTLSRDEVQLAGRYWMRLAALGSSEPLRHLHRALPQSGGLLWRVQRRGAPSRSRYASALPRSSLRGSSSPGRPGSRRAIPRTASKAAATSVAAPTRGGQRGQAGLARQACRNVLRLGISAELTDDVGVQED
jgi:hypothetical protein